MPKVLCTLPNASEEISGVKFVTHANGMLSENVTDDVAENFAAIPGYEIVSTASAPVVSTVDADAAEAAARAEAAAQAESAAQDEAAAKAEAAAQEEAKKAADAEAAKAAEAEAAANPERDALLARAQAAGLKAKGNWGIDRLKAEVEAAEKAKAEGAGQEGKPEGDAQ